MPESSKVLKVLGADMSPTGTALVFLKVDLSMPDLKTAANLEKSIKLHRRVLLNRGRHDGRADDAALRGMGIQNLAYVASALGTEIQTEKPDVAFIEDYSGGGTQNAFILACTGEVTGALKLWMFHAGVRWVEVAGGTLKKFTTGIGAGKKELMWVGAYKRWGVDQEQLGTDNNTLDAYCLARMAVAMTLTESGLYDPTKAERECFKAVRPGGAARRMGAKKRRGFDVAG